MLHHACHVSSLGLQRATTVPSRPSPQLVFPPALSARQRAALHAVGERWGLAHSSCGEGAARRITLGPADASRTIDLSLPGGGGGGESSKAAAAAVAATDGSSAAANGASSSGTGDGQELSDEQLIALLAEHLSIDAADAFAAAAAPAAQQPPAAWRPSSKAGKAKPGAKGLVSVEDFVAQVLPLLDMERDAEVAQVGPRGLGVAAGLPGHAGAAGSRAALLEATCQLSSSLHMQAKSS